MHQRLLRLLGLLLTSIDLTSVRGVRWSGGLAVSPVVVASAAVVVDGVGIAFVVVGPGTGPKDRGASFSGCHSRCAFVNEGEKKEINPQKVSIESTRKECK